MQIILSILTIASFVMSLTTWILQLIKNTKRLNLSVIDYRKFNNSAKFYVLLENKSNSVFAISSIHFNEAGHMYMCDLEPLLVKTSQCDGEIYTTKTATFPILLNSYESATHYLNFPDCKEISLTHGKTVDFEICTNRGRVKKSVTLDCESHYLHLAKHHHNK